jgi:hypothetical protein
MLAALGFASCLIRQCRTGLRAEGRETRHEREPPALHLDGLAQRGKQDIAALLKARNAILSDAKYRCHAHLREFSPRRSSCRVICPDTQFCRAGLDLFAVRGIQRTGWNRDHIQLSTSRIIDRFSGRPAAARHCKNAIIKVDGLDCRVARRPRSR